MTSTAISAQGSVLSLGTGSGTAKTITGVTLGNPTILTCTGHGFGLGDVVTIAGVGGTTTVNGTWVVTNRTTNTFAINLDTTGGAAYTTGGTATPVSWTPIANVRTFTGFDGSANIIDVTNLSSSAEEIRPGIPRFGQLSFEIDWDHGDAGQLALLARQLSQVQTAFKLVLPDTHTATWNGYVMKVPSQGGVDQVVRGTVDVRITGPVSWS
ncbi:phage tail tube protein [Limnohabitans radicicola]|uniref:Phage tail protein n=1 Tax=Limnohabitans radicicola TaxID=2771427 RepID=A0A927FIF7_9BURK|nr:phage tail tube protein [Limnohabitans radicicola]MBD8051326.1 phage tail protein [Limnohabitans radicicola]